MSHRFTDRARKVIVRAREEARHMNSASVDTEHLLLAVIRENERIAYQVTEHMGVSFSLVLSEIERKLHRKLLVRGESIPGGPDLSPRSKRVLALAADEARNVDLTYIGTEQLLRALMREKSGSAANVLRKIGLDIEIFLQLMIQSLVPEMPVGISRERSRLRSARSLISRSRLTVFDSLLTPELTPHFRWKRDTGSRIFSMNSTDSTSGCAVVCSHDSQWTF